MPIISVRRWGSIPARAGEPFQTPGTSAAHRVYPRACGGTEGSQGSPKVMAGLSPRVRGNPALGSSSPGPGRSIPARAGEPSLCTLGSFPSRVYPRACGGTSHSVMVRRCAAGLSPRVRGNLFLGFQAALQGRSIPARAGEPSPPRTPPRPGRVYPRACGGTRSWKVAIVLKGGLSPRVRGNPAWSGRPRARWRSIPARAGEPTCTRSASTTLRVYPRACGGTWRLRCRMTAGYGLSPRVRGNLLVWHL